ncbi:MAG: hypothetical protein ACI39W_03065 [Brotaphodocola sp.]
MRKIRLSEKVFLCFIIGIIVGMVLCNQMFASGLVSYAVLYEHLQRGWIYAVEGNRSFPWKIVSIRVAETAALIFLAKSRMKRSLIFLFSVWTGICASALLTIITWSRGMTGFLYFMGCISPHMAFYLASWTALILRYRSPYEVKKGRFWSAVFFLAASGLVLEILVNPKLLIFLV